MSHHMLKFIERNQRIAIEEYKNRPPSPPMNLASRQISIDEPAPDFCIPSLKAQRKVSSAEEMARKNSEAAAQSSASATSVTGNIRSTCRHFQKFKFFPFLSSYWIIWAKRKSDSCTECFVSLDIIKYMFN